MKEYDLILDKIFTGITASRVDNKRDVKLSECHNLEPVESNYNLHEFVVDMDTDSYNWGNA